MLDFPHSAMSQNYLFESGVLSYMHGAKSLLTTQKSASSVCLCVPSSMNYIITCQPLPMCCTIDILGNNSRGKSGACALTVAHTYTYSRSSITSTFSNIFSMFSRAPTLPKKQHPGLLWDFLTSAGFNEVATVNRVSISTAKHCQLLGYHIWSCVCGSGVCFQRSCFQRSKVLHPCIIIDVSPLRGRHFSHCVAILVLQTNRPAGAQHISFFSQTCGFPSDRGMVPCKTLLQHACHQSVTRGCSSTWTWEFRCTLNCSMLFP